MPHRRGHWDVSYFVPGRKRVVAGSTRATSDFLASIHPNNPTLTVFELKELLSNRTRFIPNPEALRVLDQHIAAGFCGYIPDWR